MPMVILIQVNGKTIFPMAGALIFLNGVNIRDVNIPVTGNPKGYPI